MNKNETLLKDFIAYCQKHPEQRFWQALRNWSGYKYIFGADSYEDTALKDTFYIE